MTGYLFLQVIIIIFAAIVWATVFYMSRDMDT